MSALYCEVFPQPHDGRLTELVLQLVIVVAPPSNVSILLSENVDADYHTISTYLHTLFLLLYMYRFKGTKNFRKKVNASEGKELKVKVNCCTFVFSYLW